MQTTLRLDDNLYRRAKATAAEQGVTLTRFIEEALQLRLEKRPPVRTLNLPSFDSGLPFDYTVEELKKLGQDSDWGGDDR
jgi:antitoxin component of RelBE/YafQ-DinJ toxin-antitoxin module